MTLDERKILCMRCHDQKIVAGVRTCLLQEIVVNEAIMRDCPAGRFCGAIGPEPRGLGDLVGMLTAVTGVKAMVGWWSQWTGRPCGCEERQKRINEVGRPLMKAVRGAIDRLTKGL